MKYPHLVSTLFLARAEKGFKWKIMYLFWKDVDDGDDELFLHIDWPVKGVEPYFQLGPFSEILTIANLRHAASRIRICAEPKLRL